MKNSDKDPDIFYKTLGLPNLAAWRPTVKHEITKSCQVYRRDLVP